jgi:N-acetylneuraminic acid mutarotase
MVDFINHNPSAQQYPFNSTQTSVIGTWTSGTALPGTLGGAASIVTKDRVFLLGGYSGYNTVTTVYTAPLSSGVVGTWASGTALAVQKALACAFMTRDRIYLAGGDYGGATNTVHYADIDTDDGTLGTWTADTGNNLNTSRYGAACFVTKNRVYVVGGWGASAATASVEYADIASDGSLGSWTAGTSFPYTIYGARAVVTDSRVYLIGGHVNSSSGNTVYYADFDTDGVLGTWTADTNCNSQRIESAAVVTAGRVWAFGGRSTSSSYYSTVSTAPVDGSGVIGTWAADSAFTGARRVPMVFVTSARIYICGGQGATGTTYNTVMYASFSGGFDDYLDYAYEATVETGTASGSLQELEGSASPPYEIGTASGSFSELSGTATGTRIISNVTINGALSQLSGVAYGSGVAREGALQQLTGVATATRTGYGLASGNFKQITGSSVGSVTFVGTGSGVLKGLTGSSAAMLPVGGRAFGLLGSLSGIGVGLSGTLTNDASGDLDQLEGAATAIIPDVTFSDLRYSRGVYS